MESKERGVTLYEDLEFETESITEELRVETRKRWIEQNRKANAVADKPPKKRKTAAIDNGDENGDGQQPGDGETPKPTMKPISEAVKKRLQKAQERIGAELVALETIITYTEKDDVRPHIPEMFKTKLSQASEACSKRTENVTAVLESGQCNRPKDVLNELASIQEDLAASKTLRAN
eukprot:207161-Karenia_brevis.AAC.1